jgi:hypothetical protein
MKAARVILAMLFCFDAFTSAQQPTTGARPSASPSPGGESIGKSALILPPQKTQPAIISRFEQPPVIDGRLDDEAWKHAGVFKDFYQIQPGDNIPPSRPTEVLMGYDQKFLYVAFHAYDEPEKVRTTVPKRDAIFDDDHVGIVLDTYNDQRRAYGLYFNPLGVQADAILTEGRGDDFSVDLVMVSKGGLSDDGYTVEVAIPFKSLRYEARKSHVWGVHLFRRIKRFNDELSSWMPISRDKSGQLNQAGHIAGLEGISTSRTLEIIPNLTLSEIGKRVPSLPASQSTHATPDPGRFINKPVEFEPGLTMKLGLTPTITLDFAANPDFAEVEADQLVIRANQRFPIFFAEKRPFFLEGIDIFQTRLNAVHTRTILDPDVAGKLTGKRGRNTFGLLFASDNAPGSFSEEERTDPAFRPSIEKFINKNAHIGILRLKRDVGKESNIGLLATTYNFIERRNHVGGVDGRFRLDPQTIFAFQILGTATRAFFFDPDKGRDVYGTHQGLGYSWNYDRSGRHFSFNVGGEGRTRDYRADVGFTRRFDTNFQGLLVTYNSEPKPKARLISWRAYNVASTNFDWQGRMQNWLDEVQVRLNLRRQTFINFGFNFGYERVFEEEFGPRRTLRQRGAFAGDDPERSTYKQNVFASFGTTPNKRFSMFMLGSYDWDNLDFDFGAGPRFPRVSPGALVNPNAPLDPGPGNQLDITSSFVYQPTDALRASLNYTKSRLVRHDTGLVAFDDNIFAFRATYQFTRFTFARARVDYDTLTSKVLGQFLLGWAPNPGTSMYIGYNDDLNHNGFSPLTGHFESGFRRNERIFFVKMSYLFRRAL